MVHELKIYLMQSRLPHRPAVTRCPSDHRQFAGDVSGLIVLAMHPGWVQTDLGNSVGPAPLSPAASCRGMYDTIEAATRAHNGKFIDYQGHKIRW